MRLPLKVWARDVKGYQPAAALATAPSPKCAGGDRFRNDAEQGLTLPFTRVFVIFPTPCFNRFGVADPQEW